MVMKPNYRQERMSRDRNKKSKQQDKLRRREEDAAKRKAQREGGAITEPEPETDLSKPE